MKKLRIPLSEQMTPEDQETLLEMQQVNRVLTMINRASILVLAIGGIAILAARESASASAVTCSGVCLLINLWMIIVEVPAGFRRSRKFFYDDARGVWRAILKNSLGMVVILAICCTTIYWVMRNQATSARSWTVVGVTMLLLSGWFVWYQRYMTRLIAALDAPVGRLRVNTLPPAAVRQLLFFGCNSYLEIVT